MMPQRGDVVERYLLQERLGAGSFGEVWKASQLADRKDVGVVCALKLMKFAQDHPAPISSGWLDEVRNLVRLGSDIIPRILEANVWNEYAYIAMELLEGTTLGTRLAHGPIPWRRALFIADQIARALEAAHRADVVHRDLKPQNIMLVGHLRVCVIDWGIASLKSSTARPPVEGVARLPTLDSGTTDDLPIAPIPMPQRQRVVFGTPGYMAPEVYDGALPAPEQDVYALGVVLYEMIAGCLPYAVDPPSRNRPTLDALKAYRASLEKATMDYAMVPLHERCPGVPRLVAQLVDRLLARDPEQRPRYLVSALDLANQFPHGVPNPPYVGLSTLEAKHAGLYFGQQEAVQHVLDRLRTEHGALLWGPSGSGKSSLALAGVAATMDRTLFLDTDGWDVHVVRPREDRSFHVVSDATTPQRSETGQVVVLDQLEEVVDLEPADRERFCAAVLALLDRSAAVRVGTTVIGVAGEVKMIATIRDDLEWRIDREVPALRPLLERRIIVKGVDANFSRNIIERPARTVEYEVEAIEAVSREVEECLSAEPTKLPMVQYALSEWWERRDRTRRLLPVAAWKELGGVDGALSFAAERLFSKLDLAQRLRLKTLLVRMFPNGRRQPLAESTLAPEDIAMMEELIRLRLVERRDRKDSARAYEVEHEALAERWSRLAGWLAEAREDRLLAEELERDATAYARDHAPERLWKKGRIAAVTEMAGRGRILLSPAATQFLKHARRREQRSRFAMLALICLGIVLAIFGVRMVLFDTMVSRESAQMAAKLHQAEGDSGLLGQQIEERNHQLQQAQDDRQELQKRLKARGTQIDSERANFQRQLEDTKASLNAVIKERDAALYRAKTAEEAAQIENHHKRACEEARYLAEHLQRVAEQAASECAIRSSAGNGHR